MPFKDPQRHRENTAKWHAAHRAERDKHNADYRQRNREKIRAYQRKFKGLPEPTRPCPEACELCGAAPLKQGLHLDHCHTTNTFRGWLCRSCNMGLGHFRDEPELLKKAISYLTESNHV